MKSTLLNGLANLHKDESGQGLVEYVLIIGLVALGAIAGMSSLATKINTAFNNVGSTLSTYVQ